jgi:UDP-2,3-diacylglucosamine hydrolase
LQISDVAIAVAACAFIHFLIIVSTWFISDLHLDGSRPDITQQFLEFLKEAASATQTLYILGDLFETWIGDDDPDADKQRVQTALKHLTTAGVRCYVTHGNRDFLLGRRFARATGVTLFTEGKVIDLHGQRVMLMHGDTLCTDDHAYQRLRRILRNPVVRTLLRSLPLARRQRLAAQLRAGSKQHIDTMERAAPAIMDVNAQAVAATFDRSKADYLIHGHTHRPAVHPLTINGRQGTRIVLGDWYTQGSVLRWDERGFELISIPR